MAPCKAWMQLVDNNRLDEAYTTGVKKFLDYAFRRMGELHEIRCPCIRCCNTGSGTREIVESHLKVFGIIKNYTFWYHHGEVLGEPQSECEDEDDYEVAESESEDEIQELLRDLYPDLDGSTTDADFDNLHEEEPNAEATKFYSLLRDFEQPLYQNSKSSKLSTLIKLLHIKSMGRWSNESFTMLLKMLKEELLPDGANLPDSYYEAKKIIRDLGLSYQKIDACKNDCMLYWKEDELLDSCKICGASRWKTDKHSGETRSKKGKKIASKTLRYFPLKSRLQRLFMSTKTSSLMVWHHDKRVDDGIMRHPADSMAWKSFDEIHPSFAAEPRNVRLGLASDGFQPFRNSKTSYSIWPVVLIPYNLPPWLCMKKENFIMSMLILGPHSPGDAIDVYLQPLIEELKELWEIGVETFDASTRQNFKLHASLLWTINDFPAYGNLSGWSTKGKLACPCCNKETCSIRLANSKKQCFMGHRRYLPLSHKWRNDKESFDGTKERRLPPKMYSGVDILDQVRDLEGLQLKKDPKKRIKISHDNRKDNWNKKSIFFELPYWKTLLLRHNLDVMHIEKNIFDNILGTIMNAKGKTKDTLNSRLDLQEMNIRPELHPIKKGEKYEVPSASYTLSPQEKHNLCLFLKNLKVPDGFSSNISQGVNLKDHKISGLKSHDCHVLLHHLLPLALRGMLSKEVCEPLFELSLFFNVLGSKTLRMDDLKQIEAQIPLTLCKLEKVFPPSFFDVMVHLPIHLANEAEIAGPIHYRWMYPVERWLYFLKSLIGNRACAEGSIAEGYIANECMTLCSRFLHNIDTKFNRRERNYDGGSKKSEGGLPLFCKPGRALRARKQPDLDENELEQAHIYILKNCDEVLPFLEEFAQIHGDATRNLSDAEWNIQFIEWFKVRVAELYRQDNSQIMEDLLSLSRGPTSYMKHFNGCIVNGYRFHVEDYDKHLRTQNCGVVVVGETDKDSENLDYYGVLTDVIELQFVMGRRVVLFRCKWFDVYDKTKGVKKDEYDFVSVNPGRFLKINEPFVLVDQASQVFYANDNSNKGWHVVRKMQPRDTFEIEQKLDDEVVDLENSTQNKRKRTERFNMKPLNTGNEVGSTAKATTKYAFVAPGSIGKGRGRGLRSLSNSSRYTSQSMKTPSNRRLDYVISGGQGMRTTNTNPLVFEKRIQTDILVPPSTDQVMKYNQTFETRATGVGQGQWLKSAGQGMQMSKNPLILEEEQMQAENTFPIPTEKLMQYIQSTNTSATEKGQGRGLRSTAPSNSARTDPTTISIGPGIQSTNKNPFVLEKERMQEFETSLSPSADQVLQHNQKVETGSSTTKKVKRVRGKNKCKEVASLEVGEKLKVTFYQNRTVGNIDKAFSRHLGKIVRDRNMCPLGVSSWNEISEEKLNHLWAAVEDKFESDEMDIHREDIFTWMKDLWNRWRGELHAKYVRGKPIQKALRNMPNGVDKKQWEWLVKEHWSSERFKARSTRNAKNRAKLKMPHRICSKPIRQIIYQKGGKDGNPPDLATIFFETRKKNETLVDSETIEKHAQIKELVQSEPSLPTIEIVEKCFGPQSRSHVVGFGGGVKAKDLKGGTSSRSELLSQLRSTREENQSLRDRLSTLENEMKEVRELKEFFLSQQSNMQPSNSPISGV